MLERLRNPIGEVDIAIVGKYVSLEEAYKSLREALTHGATANHQRVRGSMLRTGKTNPVSGHLLRVPMGGGGLREEGREDGKRQLDRGRS